TTQVFFIAAQAQDTLLIPMSALNFQPGKPRAQRKPQEKKKSASISAEKVGSTGKNDEIKNMPRLDKDKDGDSDREKRANRASVKVINANSELEDRRVTVGVTNRVQAEILSRLSEGEQVVTGMQQNTPP